MSSPHSPNQNHLLAALPTAEFERLAAHLEPVPMPLGEILYEPGGQLRHAYFPTTAIVSLHYVMESGASDAASPVYPATALNQVSGDTIRLPLGSVRVS